MNIFSWNDFTQFVVRRRLKIWLAVFAMYLSIAGLVTFSLFMLEESYQTVMFGTWPAQDAQRWDIVLEGTDLMEKMMHTMNIVNYSCGWVQPLAFISYRAYAESEEFYIKSLRAKVLHNAPELMVDRKIELKFKINNIKKYGDKFLLSNGRLVIVSDKRINGIMDIKAIIKKTEAGYELTNISGNTVPRQTR
jgi:hypothetical protein